MGSYLGHSLAEDAHIGFKQTVFLQEVLNPHQMLAVVLRAEASLDFVDPVEQVEHLLEYFVQLQREVEAEAADAQETQQFVPQAEHAVLPLVHAVHVVVPFALQLARHADHGADTLLVGKDVGLNGLVFLCSGFHRSQVRAEVVLQEASGPIIRCDC